MSTPFQPIQETHAKQTHENSLFIGTVEYMRETTATGHKNKFLLSNPSTPQSPLPSIHRHCLKSHTRFDTPFTYFLSFD